MLEALTHPGPGVKRGIFSGVVCVVKPGVIGVEASVDVLVMMNPCPVGRDKVLYKHADNSRCSCIYIRSWDTRVGLHGASVARIPRSHNQSPAISVAAPL